MRLTRRLVMGAACAAALGAPGPVLAQVRFEVTPVLGPAFFLTDPPETFALSNRDGDVVVQRGRYDDGFSAGVFAGFRLGQRWGVEGMFSWLPTKLSGVLALDGRKAGVDAYMYGVDVAYYLPPVGPLEPYVSAGGGAETYDYHVQGIDTHSDAQWNVALGTGYRLTDWLGLRLDVRDCLSRFGSGYPGEGSRVASDLMVQAGMRLRYPIRDR